MDKYNIMNKRQKINWIKIDGYTEYNKWLLVMNEVVEEILIKKKIGSVYLVEHNDVYTAGRSFKDSDLIYSDKIPITYTDRGGGWIYHGPGQRLIYPILSMEYILGGKDIKNYIKNLEQWIINVLLEFNIEAFSISGMVGIWTRYNNIIAKIAAIGIKVRKWIAYHGIAVNINPNLENYKGIIPCGIKEYSVTSIVHLGKVISIEEFDKVLKLHFDKIFIN